MKKITVILASLILTAFSCFAQEVPDTDFFSLKEGAGFRLGFTDFGFDYQEWLNENNGFSLCIGAMGGYYGSTTISITGTYYHSFMNAVVPGGKSGLVGVRLYLYGDGGLFISPNCLSKKDVEKKAFAQLGGGLGAEIYPNKHLSFYLETGIMCYAGPYAQEVYDSTISAYTLIKRTELFAMTLPAVGVRMHF